MTVKYLGIGIWENRRSAPGWDATGLGAAMVKVVQDNEKSRAMKKKAEELQILCQKKIGGITAARIIYGMMEHKV
jgi:hypothetical protein